jgi:hypothetical protein
MKKSSQKPIKRTALRAVSQKRQAQMKAYYSLVAKLKYESLGMSEWDGEIAEDYDDDGAVVILLEPHHIDGRENDRLTNPFNIILLTATQHRTFTAHHSWEVIQALKLWVRGLRLEQGFKEC